MTAGTTGSRSRSVVASLGFVRVERGEDLVAVVRTRTQLSPARTRACW